MPDTMPDCGLSVLILAGGHSTRMGRDKAWLILDGQPLAERVARRVLPLADELIFSTNRPEQFRWLVRALPLPVQLVPDQHPNAGPLAGLYAGLGAAANDLVLMLAVDMPFVNLELLRYMVQIAEGYDAVVPQVPKAKSPELAQEPLHALYRRTCLPAVARHLAAGQRRMVSFLPDVNTRFVLPEEIIPFDPNYLSFSNINTPEEWAQARRVGQTG